MNGIGPGALAILVHYYLRLTGEQWKTAWAICPYNVFEMRPITYVAQLIVKGRLKTDKTPEIV